jgi:hypothetical protein
MPREFKSVEERLTREGRVDFKTRPRMFFRGMIVDSRVIGLEHGVYSYFVDTGDREFLVEIRTKRAFRPGRKVAFRARPRKLRLNNRKGDRQRYILVAERATFPPKKKVPRGRDS